jgi:hypothetical protein
MLIISGGGPLSVLASALVAVVTLAVLTFVGRFTDRLLGGYADEWARRLHDQDQDRDQDQTQERDRAPTSGNTGPSASAGGSTSPNHGSVLAGS